jgi:voltage-gated potassium channel
MRARLYEVLTNPQPGDRAGRTVYVGLLLLITANVAASVMQTDPELGTRWAEFFLWFERISVALFTIEYLARLWACTTDPEFMGTFGRLRFVLAPMMLIDVAAISPFYIELLWPGALDLRFLRVLRLLRIFRLFRMRRVANAFALLSRVIEQKRYEIGVTLALVAVSVVLAAGAIYAVEHDEPGSAFTSIPRAMWWSVVTITTVGYGDMTPQTALGQVIGGFVAFVGICALALPVGILSSGFVDEINKRHEQPEPVLCPHCGRTIAPDQGENVS